MDVNFFDPIKKQKKQTNVVLAVVAGILIAAFLGLSLMIVLKEFEKRATRESINTLNASLTSESMVAQSRQVAELEKRIDDGTTILAQASGFGVSAVQLHTASKDTIVTLKEQLPRNTNLTNITITDADMSVAAESSDLDEIAQFLYNCETCGLFTEVSLDAIAAETGGDVYTYTIEMVIVPATEGAAGDLIGESTVTTE